ncbi:hypothetical protein [Amycolatopsis anabasis]|uniref:hypothetical protein n=1 Tax=Amycolatopsis anabasis TaxID=1840409 RepID=UPI00131E828D|nr:hypothetical protein [Amycolatopsis anabasis]
MEHTDLGLVLGRLAGSTSSTRKTGATRRRLANDPLTREYLDAGCRIIAARFADRQHDAAGSVPFFSWITQDSAIREVASGPAGLRGSLGTFRDRWPFRSHYLEDLIAYSLWKRRLAVAGVHTGRDGRAVLLRELADRELQVLLADSAHRVSMITALTGEQAADDLYRERRAAWSSTYRELLSGARLRPGVTIDELAGLATALVEGFALLTFAGQRAGTGNHRSLLGMAIVALTAGCLDHGDGRPLDDSLA